MRKGIDRKLVSWFGCLPLRARKGSGRDDAADRRRVTSEDADGGFASQATAEAAPARLRARKPMPIPPSLINIMAQVGGILVTTHRVLIA